MHPLNHDERRSALMKKNIAISHDISLRIDHIVKNQNIMKSQSRILQHSIKEDSDLSSK